MQVKIIESRQERCEQLCEALPKATIIHGDAADHDLLMEEGIGEADAVIALTGMDEENIIMSLFAKTQGVNKIVAKVNDCLLYTSVSGGGIHRSLRGDDRQDAASVQGKGSCLCHFQYSSDISQRGGISGRIR